MSLALRPDPFQLPPLAPAGRTIAVTPAPIVVVPPAAPSNDTVTPMQIAESEAGGLAKLKECLISNPTEHRDRARKRFGVSKHAAQELIRKLKQEGLISDGKGFKPALTIPEGYCSTKVAIARLGTTRAKFRKMIVGVGPGHISPVDGGKNVSGAFLFLISDVENLKAYFAERRARDGANTRTDRPFSGRGINSVTRSQPRPQRQPTLDGPAPPPDEGIDAIALVGARLDGDSPDIFEIEAPLIDLAPIERSAKPFLGRLKISVGPSDAERERSRKRDRERAAVLAAYDPALIRRVPAPLEMND